MLKIGITGGIGSGKTLVCNIFHQMGIPVYNADERAKYLIANHPAIRQEIKTLFGPESYTDNIYNRKYIASKVFTNSDLLIQLNKIVHPYVAEDFASWVSLYADKEYVIEEAAILFESGANKKMDFTILVDAPLKNRIDRIKKRDNLTEEEIKNRISKQYSTDKIRPLVDWVIDNDNKQLILPQILKIHNHLISFQG